MSTAASVLCDLVTVIAQALVDSPESVRVELIEGQSGIILTLRVGAREAGQVIGKAGQLAGSIRLILNGVAAKLGKKILLEIVG